MTVVGTRVEKIRGTSDGLGTFTCGSIGTFCRSVGRTGRFLIDGLVGLGKVITAEDVLVGWVDVSCVGLLADRLGFPAEWDERYDIIVVSNKRSCTRVGEEDVIAGVVIVET